MDKTELEVVRLCGKERKKFFSNDFTERMIRVEQKVSASFGDHVPYNKTEYYKSLSDREKEDFENYLKNKGKVRVVIGLVLIIPMFIVLLFNAGFTGNAVRESIGSTTSLGISYFFVFAVVIALFAVVFVYVSRKNKNRRLNKHIEVIDNIIIRKRFARV